MRDFDTSKAAGIDKLRGKFLKDEANVRAKPVTDIGNLSISLNKFPSASKLAKVNLFSVRDEKLMSSYCLTANFLTANTLEGH